MYSLRNRYTDLDKCLEDYSVWFVENRTRMNESNSSGLAQQVRFLSLAVDGSLYLVHLLRDELRKTQQRARTQSALWLPVSFR